MAEEKQIEKLDLITLLGELGYVETIDPRVKNIASREDGGYGIAGDVVTVGNETFRTRYNTVPLLYNKNTTRCLESEYFWFPTQEDENTGKLSASECASKATTWGVFESIETGERYIVVSGHFRGTESVQLNQAKEIAAEIAKLVEKYDCPVFLGGDFNGRTSRAFYAYLTEELDYVSMQDSAIAKQFTSPILTTHGYPRYSESLGIMTDGGGAVSQISKSTNGDSIDKIFVSNYDNVSLEIFGVIVDECSLSSSDHLPMVVDFSINSK
jgi:endonuclease/exonuclease/phosphatase family metal-dependent hydrolase